MRCSLQPLADIITKEGMKFHMYADDTQLYISVEPRSAASLDVAANTISSCTQAIQQWMIANCLKLNSDKTEVLAISTPSLTKYQPQSLYVCGVNVNTSHSVKSLGVHLDRTLSMSANIASICKKAYYQIHLIAKIRNDISEDAAKKLVKDNVLSHLDYCNSLLAGLPDNAISRLQRVQNCAARLVKRTNRRSHITPVLKDLHWLPVKFRIMYKINLLTYNALQNNCPMYLTELLHEYNPIRTLRSSQQNLLCVPSFKLKSFGARSFSVCAPQLWNSLPKEIRCATSVGIFKSKLKTHYFSIAFE